MRPRHTLLAVAALTFTIAACGDSNAPDMSHVGLYDMLSVDGDPLPVTVYDVPNNMLQVTEGSLALKANNSFVESVTLVQTLDGVVGPGEPLSCTGHYTRRGNTVTMTSPETDSCAGGSVTGTLSGSTLTVDYDGTTVVFSR